MQVSTEDKGWWCNHGEKLEKEFVFLAGSQFTMNPDKTHDKYTHDLIYKGKPAIVDFKQTNRPKQESWVLDYKLQLAAYAMAHNALFDTKISTGVILMCSRERYFQKFELTTEDYWYICCQWMTRVAEFYGN